MFWNFQFFRNIKFKVHKSIQQHYLLFMFSPPKISRVVSEMKYICLHLLPVFYLIQPSSRQIICFDFRKQNSVLPIVFYVPDQIIANNLFANIFLLGQKRKGIGQRGLKCSSWELNCNEFVYLLFIIRKKSKYFSPLLGVNFTNLMTQSENAPFSFTNKITLNFTILLN